ncbi:MAG TPA: DsbA family protein, partial [Rhizobiales bacterium]|nr:DsbA family protein [Hyphomicrobiales bacterium]
DPLAAAASMLTRCVDKENYYAFINLLFKQQKSWAYSDSPVDSLRKISLQAGLSSESFDKCLTNQKLLDGILKIKDTAAKVLEINSTPTFDVNGEIIRGGMPLKDFEKLIRDKLRK